MSKYSPLSEHLKNRTKLNGYTNWKVSFQEIEKIVGFKLPNSAYEHAPWWANSKGGHSQSASWQDIGWLTTELDLENEMVTFKPNPLLVARNIKIIETKPLSIEEAKAGLAVHFGINVKNIEIIIRG